MIRIYKRKGHKVTRGDFERVPTRKVGFRYTAKCRHCDRRLRFEIVMGEVEPKGISNAIGMEHCMKTAPAKAKKWPR